VRVSRTELERVIDYMVPGLSLLLRRASGGRELRSLVDVYSAGEALWGSEAARFFLRLVARRLDELGLGEKYRVDTVLGRDKN